MAKTRLIKINNPFCLPCKGRWVQLIAPGGIGKIARTSSPCYFWRFPSFARGQYPRTAPTRKIRNLSRFLEVCRHIEKALHSQGFLLFLFNFMNYRISYNAYNTADYIKNYIVDIKCAGRKNILQHFNYYRN